MVYAISAERHALFRPDAMPYRSAMPLIAAVLLATTAQPPAAQPIEQPPTARPTVEPPSVTQPLTTPLPATRPGEQPPVTQPPATQAPPTPAPGEPPAVTESFRPLAGTPGFRGLRQELQRTVDWFGHARVNHFCVVLQTLRTAGEPRPELSAITFWQEEWRVQGYGQGFPDAMVTGLNTPGALYVDLRHGVVPTPDDINGSTYVVDRAWADRLLRNCWRHGVSWTLIRHPKRYDPDHSEP